VERNKPRPGKLPEEIGEDKGSVHYMLDEGDIKFPSEYDEFGKPGEFTEAVVEILASSPSYPNPVTCEKCEDEGIPRPHLDSDISMTEYEPGEAGHLRNNEVDELERQGMKIYEVEIHIECSRHASEDFANDVSMSYTEHIEAVPGSLDL